MKTFSLSRFLATIVLFSAVIASCSRSPYRYIKVDPEPFPEKQVAQTLDDTDPEEAEEPAVTASVPQEQKADQAEEAESADSGTPEEVVSVKVDPEAVATISPQPQKAKEPVSKVPQIVVHRESPRPAAYNALPEKKQQRAEKRVSRAMDRVAKKPASSSSSSAAIFLNQWMKIGLILVVVGLVVGIAWGALGWVVTVIGLVFFILGLIQQM